MTGRSCDDFFGFGPSLPLTGLRLSNLVPENNL
jgi:hypothetical protein